MDILSDILRVMALSGSVAFRAELRGPFGLRLPAHGQATRFHLVLAGSCWVKVPYGGPAQQLSAGDLIIIPHGAAQTLSDRPDRRANDLTDVMNETVFGDQRLLTVGLPGEQPETRLISGACEIDTGARHPLLASLPPVLLIRSAESLHHPWLSETVRYLMHEAHAGEPGHQAVLDRLAEVLVIQAIRALAARSDTGGFLAALNDPTLGKAITAMHARPAAPWTLTTLAREAGLSRSRFAELFHERVGQPPMDYLTDWRLMKARRLLTASRVPVAAVAQQVGYASLPSFTRRFKQRFGIGPGTWRKGG